MPVSGLRKLKELIDRLATPADKPEPAPRWEKEGFSDYGLWHGTKVLAGASPKSQEEHAMMRKRTLRKKAEAKAAAMGKLPSSRERRPFKKEPGYTGEVDPNAYPGGIGVVHPKQKNRMQ